MRVFEREHLEGVTWQGGCFAQGAAGDWWLCLPVKLEAEQSIAPQEAVGIDLGVKDIAVTRERLAAGKRQAKRIHRQSARARADALHKFSSRILGRYQNIIVGELSSLKLASTRMAKSVLDSGWGMPKRSTCGALSGPRGVNGLIVRSWVCRDRGESHDRDQNAARNILIGSRWWTSGRNESSPRRIAPSRAYRVCEAGTQAARAAA